MKRDLNACSLSPSLSCHVRTPQRGSQPCEKQNPPCRHPDLGFQPPELRGAHVCCLSPSVTPAAAAQADQASRLSYIITFPPLQDGFPSCRNWSTAAPPPTTTTTLSSSLIFLQPPRSFSALFYSKTRRNCLHWRAPCSPQCSLAPIQGRSYAHIMPTSPKKGHAWFCSYSLSIPMRS